MFLELGKTQHRDIVWDVYLKDSLKLSTITKTGAGICKRDSSHGKLPGNWKHFLRNVGNKYGSRAGVCFQARRRQCHSTHHIGLCVSYIDRQNTDVFQPCAHEETDTRMILHVKDATNCGFKSVMIRTVDTDVVMLNVAHFQGLPNIEQTWIALVRNWQGLQIDPDTRDCLCTKSSWPNEGYFLMHSPAVT